MSEATFLEWVSASPLSQSLRNSGWMLPVIESAHLLGYGLLIGTILAVDLRMLGWGGRRQPAAQIARELAFWTMGGLITAVITGLLLFAYDPVKFYANHAFPFKILFLAAAVANHYT